MNCAIIKYMKKSKLFILAIGLFYAVTCGFGLFFVKLGMTGFMVLHILVRFNFYICFFAVILAYYIISRAGRYNLKEVTDAIGKHNVYENTALVLWSIIMVVWHIAMLLMLLLCSVRNDGSSYFLTWFLKNYVVNVVIPQAICIIITYIISGFENSNRLMMGELLFLFMISPLAEEIKWSYKPDIPIDRVWYMIRWPFTILYQNGEWSPDVQNDLQLENVRILVQVFWILLLLGVLLYIRYNKKSMAIPVMIAAVLVLGLSYMPASLYRLSEDYNGINSDMTYYTEKEMTRVVEKNNNYEITDYDLTVSLGNELEICGYLTLVANSNLDEFVVTLYHGYNIKELRSTVDDVTINYTRDGDIIKVKLNKKTDNIKLYIRYRGHSNKYYANSRAMILPGYFPWYPMAGEKQIYVRYEEAGKIYGYNPYNRMESAHVTIRIDEEIITNLLKKEEGIYEGETDSITILAGNIVAADDEVVRDYLPLGLSADTDASGFITREKSNYENVLKVLKERYGYNVEQLENKRLIFVSKDMARNNFNNDIAIFEDYIIAVPGYITVDSLIRNEILKHSNEKADYYESELLRLFMRVPYGNDSDEIVRYLIEELKEQKINKQYYEKTVEHIDEWLEILSRTDKEQFVRDMFEYTLFPEKYIDEDEFLERHKK